jgi:hypothetical protein
MFTQVWRLSGLAGSEPGHLELRGGRLIYSPIDETRPGFDVSLADVGDVRFPWYYFSGGFKMRIRGEEFRFSFVQPHNEFADISGGREAGKAWKKILLGS